MTDRHMRILRHMARQSQRRLDRPDTLPPAANDAPTRPRDDLGRTARRARAQVAAAEQRREGAEARPPASPPAREARP